MSNASKMMVHLDYTNWRGERRVRRVVPHGIFFGTSEHHIEPQWLLVCLDVDEKVIRNFAISGIHSWTGNG